MDVVGTTLSATLSLSSALRRPELKHILSIYGYESKLEELQNTVDKIKNVLLNAEAKQELSYVVQLWIENLKDVVFEADDLLDEFITLVEQKQHIKADGTISKKMRLFLSRSNPLVLAYKMSKEVEKIGKNLSSFADKISSMMEFSLEPIKNRNRETCSYVDVVDIVGREVDLQHIVGKLLDYDVQNDVSFLPIVGMGGLGKSALAQLVYNDKRVESAFSLRLWHCVSDQDQKQLNIADILRKILALIIDKNHEGSSEQIVQSQLQKELSSKKYLLVLDDVWTENCNQWNDLVRVLNVGQRGSWIVVTTRSEVTAKFIGYDSMYQLQGLAKENAWSLFEKIAFGSEHSNLHDDELVKIGQKIVEACGGVPLALRVAGSLVYGQDKKKWERVQEVGVANIGNDDNVITQILKLSYHHLPFSLKSCFSYCAIFPKDHRMKKETLINLWMAQNYIIPLHEGQSLGDAGEDHFLILLKRCFFQDIEKDYLTDEILSVKIHDLLHDIAQGVASIEIYVEDPFTCNLNKKVRHISNSSNTFDRKYSLGKTRARSYLDIPIANPYRETLDNFFVEALVENCRYLRALKLGRLSDQCLSDSIGKLLHLRYLDLSHNKSFKVLPKSITKLSNLETLILYDCEHLYELPKDFSSLVKLKVLDNSGCHLNYMPKGMDKLTCITRLSKFKVGGGSYSSWTEWFYGLEELKSLNNLKGDLQIDFIWPDLVREVENRKDQFYLKNKKHLNHIYLLFDDLKNFTRTDNMETIKLMEDLHPPLSLRTLQVDNYPGTRMSRWISILPNLVNLILFSSDRLLYLETFGNAQNKSILPSLEKLELINLWQLRGWRNGEDLLSCLPRLKMLKINSCNKLMSIPLCPMVEKLHFMEFNKTMTLQKTTGLASRNSVQIIWTRVATDNWTQGGRPLKKRTGDEKCWTPSGRQHVNSQSF